MDDGFDLVLAFPDASYHVCVLDRLKLIAWVNKHLIREPRITGTIFTAHNGKRRGSDPIAEPLESGWSARAGIRFETQADVLKPWLLSRTLPKGAVFLDSLAVQAGEGQPR